MKELAIFLLKKKGFWGWILSLAKGLLIFYLLLIVLGVILVIWMVRKLFA